VNAVVGPATGAAIVLAAYTLWSLVDRFLDQQTDPRFVGVDQRPMQNLGDGLIKSWCRVAIRNYGADGQVRVRLVGVRPFVNINGMLGALRPVGLPSQDGHVLLHRGEPQYFDLVMMACPPKDRWIPRYHARGGPQPLAPRRMFTYAVLLQDGGENGEHITPNHTRYEFDISFHGTGARARSETVEIKLTKRGPTIRRVGHWRRS